MKIFLQNPIDTFINFLNFPLYPTFCATGVDSFNYTMLQENSVQYLELSDRSTSKNREPINGFYIWALVSVFQA